MTRFLLPLLLVGVTLSAGPLSGRRAPSFALPDVQQRYHDILDYRGKVVLVDIMQTGCPHCIQLSATLEKVKAKYGPKIQILSIVVPPDTLQTVADFVAKSRVSSPILFDCGQVVAAYMKITPQNPSVSFPHLFVVDAQGMIRDDIGGEPASNLNAAAIGAMIDKAAAPAAPAKK